MKGGAWSRDCLEGAIVGVGEWMNGNTMLGGEGGGSARADRLQKRPPIPDRERRRASGQDVRGAPNTFSSPVEDMRIDHRRADVFMAEQLLDRPDIVPVFEQVSRERMPQTVTGDMLRYGGPHGRVLDGALNHRLVEVVPERVSRDGIGELTVRGENPLPAPLPVRVGVFPRQCSWKFNMAASVV